MKTWYIEVADDLSKILEMFAYYEKELIEASEEIKISGSVESHSARLPGQTEQRFNQLQDIEAILEHLNIELRKERSRTFKSFLEHTNTGQKGRALSSADSWKFTEGEDSVVELSHLTNRVGLLRNRYLGILKGLENKNWQLGSIVRLRVAGLEDIVI